MPIYEYQCNACGHQLEKLQKINDPPLVSCPACSEDQLRKMISAAGFRLKGGGWYETDFKTGSKRNVAGSEAKPGSSEKKSEGKAAKPSSAGETKGKAGSKSA